MLASPALAQTTHYVAVHGQCGELSPCHSTVVAGVAAAMADDTVAVFPGIYDEAVTLSDKAGIELKTHAPDKIGARVCKAIPDAKRATLTRPLALGGGNAGARITGLALPAGVQVTGPASSLKITGNTIGGLFIANCVGATLRHNVFSDDVRLNTSAGCVFEDNAFNGADFTLDPAGIATETIVRDNVFSAGELSFVAEDTRDNVVMGNRIDGGGLTLGGRDAERNLIEQNAISGGGSLRLTASGGFENRVLRNQVAGSTATGLFVEIRVAGGNEISGNTVLGSTGCDIEDTSHPDVDNTWTDNEFGTACGEADG
ncbi:MAG: NosD domain-containing protein [Gammaproteobacteria bacterium]